MTVCKKCGAQIEEGNTFCTVCGTLLDSQSTEPAPNQGAEQIESQEKMPTAKEYPLDEAPKWNSEPANTTEQQAAAPQWIPYQQPVSPLPAAPAKKSGKGKKAIIFAACAVLVLGIGGYVGKTYFARDLMKLFMGQNKYAQSVEQSTAYGLADKTVQTFDTFTQSLPMQSKNQAYDSQGTLHIELNSNFSSQLTQQMGVNDTALKNLLDYINALSFKGSSNINNQTRQSTIEISHKSEKLLTCNTYMDKNGKYFYQMPELSKIYLVNDSSLNPLTFASKYDSAKLNASLRALAKIYVDAVPDAKTSIQEDQSLSIDGLSVTAEKISITFTSEQCRQMVSKMLETIKNDEYFYTFISDNYNTLSKSNAKLDKAQYQKALDSMINELKSGSNSSSTGSLIVSAYVMPDGTQAAHSYEFTGMKGDVSKINLNFISTQKNGFSQAAMNVLADGKEYASANVLYSSANSGTMQFSVKGSSQNMNIGLKVEFSDIAKTKFSNTDVTTGTYKFSISDPNNFLQNAVTKGAGTQNNILKNIAKSSLTITNKMENNALSSKFAFDLTGIAAISINQKSTAKESSTVTIPTVNENEAILVGSSATYSRSQQKLQSSFTNDMNKYVTSLLSKDKELADIIKSFSNTQNRISAYPSLYTKNA